MANIPANISSNSAAFLDSVFQSYVDSRLSLSADQRIIESYHRIASINALRVDIIEPYYPKEAYAFFVEAHNDLLISHTNAVFGSWRPALQSMRSFIENSLAAFFFKDHPIEYQKWAMGTYRIEPKDLREYATEHPKVASISKELDLKQKLDKEYSELSKAVHGQNIAFRMTASDGKVTLSKPEVAEFGKWWTRETNTIELISTILIAAESEKLEGAKHPVLRQELTRTVRPNTRAKLKEVLGVVL